MNPAQSFHRTTGIACLALSMSLVGSYVALSKPLTLVFPVLLLAWLRFGIGGIAMLNWIKKPFNEPAMSAQTKRLIFVESLLGNFLFSIFMLYGVSMTSAVNAGVIMALIPAVIAIMSWGFLREKISIQVWLAIGFGVIGIVLYSLSNSELYNQLIQRLSAFYPDNYFINKVQNNTALVDLNSSSGNETTWLGNLLLIGAVLCEAAYAVIGKKLSSTVSPKRISALINAWGFAMMTPLGIYAAWRFNFQSVAINTWLLLIFYALAASVWSVWLWMTGLKVISASAAGVYTVFLPISTALVGLLVLGENLNFLQFLGLAMALAGVFLATLRPMKNSTFTPV